MGNIDKLVGEEAPLEVGQKINEIVETFNHFNSLPIGSIVPVNANESYVPEGCLPCDGATYSRSQFKDFCNNYLGGKEPLLNVCTLAEYEAEVATYGQCSKFGADRVTKIGLEKVATSATINVDFEQFRSLYPDGIELKFIFDGSNWTLDGKVVNLSDYALSSTGTPNKNNYFTVGYWFGYVNSFRVPLIKDGAVIQQALTDDELGKSYNAGLPNIEGGFKASMLLKDGEGYGAVTSERIGSSSKGDSGHNFYQQQFTLNASLSNSIYGNSDTVQMNAVALRYFVVVANGQTNQSMMNWSEWASSLQGKADKTAVDGQWVKKIIMLSTATAAGTYELDLSTLLPNDDYSYEVIIGYAFADSDTRTIDIYSNLIPQGTAPLARITSGGTQANGRTIIPVGVDRILYLSISGAIDSNFGVEMLAYRRIGTNQ